MNHFLRALKLKAETVPDGTSREILVDLYHQYNTLKKDNCCNVLCQGKKKHKVKSCPHYYDLVFDIAYKRGGPLFHLIEQVYQFVNYDLKAECGD